MENFLKVNNIHQLYISHSLNINNTIFKHINIKNYSSNKENTLFFGMYYIEDYKMVEKHKGKKWILWGGNDTDTSNKGRVRLMKNIKNVEKHIAYSDDVYKNLLSIFDDNLIKFSNFKFLSVVVSIFNADNFIDQFVDKISKINLKRTIINIYNFTQSHKNQEHIKKKLNEIISKNINIININYDMDLYETWNLAIKNVNTKYVSNLNIDDYVDYNYYETCIDFLESNNDISLVSSNYYAYDKNKKITKREHFKSDNDVEIYDINDLIYYNKDKKQFFKNNIPHCCPIWRKNLHDKFGFFDSKKYDFCGDFEFWARCLYNEEKFANLKKYLIYNYVDNNTASDKVWYEHNKRMIEINKEFPYDGYKMSHLGQEHDKIHYILNRKIINLYKPKVTILVTTYNKEKYIQNTLNTIYNQIYKKYYILCIDDKSTDNTVNILNDNIKKSKKLTYFVNDKNYNRSISRNKLIKYCDSENFVILDGDDILKNSYLNNLVNYKKSNDYLVFGNFEHQGHKCIFKNELYLKDFAKGWTHMSSILYKKSLIIPEFTTEFNNKNMFRCGEDWDWVYNLLKLNNLYLKNCNNIIFDYNFDASTSKLNREITVIDTIFRLFKNNLISNLDVRLNELFTLYLLKGLNFTNEIKNYDINLYNFLLTYNYKFNKNKVLKCISQYYDLKDFNMMENILITHIYLKVIKNYNYNYNSIKNDKILNQFFKLIKEYLYNNSKNNIINVIGNGPSTKNFNFENMNNKNDISIGMNSAYRYWEKINIYPDIYCCLDVIVLESHSKEIYELIKFNDKIKLFYLRNSFYKIYPELINNPKIITFEEIGNKLLGLFDKPIITTGSESLKLAISLNYKYINLYGIDLNYIEKVNGSKLESENNNTYLVIEKEEENNNYFFQGYQRKGDKYNLPDPNLDYHMEKYGKHLHLLAFDTIYKTFTRDKLNIKIKNKSTISKLEYF